MIVTLAAGVIWLLAGIFVTRLAPCRAAGFARLALVATGVPLLGWVTYACGPLAGLGGLVIGAVVLLSCRLPRISG